MHFWLASNNSIQSINRRVSKCFLQLYNESEHFNSIHNNIHTKLNSSRNVEQNEYIAAILLSIHI